MLLPLTHSFVHATRLHLIHLSLSLVMPYRSRPRFLLPSRPGWKTQDMPMYSWYVRTLKKLTRSQSFLRFDCSGTDWRIEEKTGGLDSRRAKIKKKKRRRKERRKKRRKRDSASRCTLRKKRLRMSLTAISSFSAYIKMYYINERTVLWSKPVSELRQVKRYLVYHSTNRRFGSTRRLSDETIYVYIYAEVVANSIYIFYTHTHTYVCICIYRYRFGRIHFLLAHTYIHTKTRII